MIIQLLIKTIHTMFELLLKIRQFFRPISQFFRPEYIFFMLKNGEDYELRLYRNGKRVEKSELKKLMSTRRGEKILSNFLSGKQKEIEAINGNSKKIKTKHENY